MEPIWMVNDVGGRVLVTPRFIYIYFSHSRPKCREYKIDAVLLYRKLRGMIYEFEMGRLTFIPICMPNGEKDIAILDKNTCCDKDQAVVIRGELLEALYFWV